MRSFLKYLFLGIYFFSFFFPLFLNAQKISIEGLIANENESPLPGATLFFINTSDSLRQNGTVSNLEGKFQLNLDSGNYKMTVSFLGFKDTTLILKAKKEEIDLGVIKLKENEEQLEEVVITHKMVMSRQRRDTTEFNAIAFKTNPEANSINLISKIPGISFVEGKIIAFGEEISEILLDGKPFFGSDMQKALGAIPAHMVKSVQVYEKPNDKGNLTGFNNSERRKVINLVTKPQFRNSVFGDVNGALGTQDAYSLNGRVNKFGNSRMSLVVNSNSLNMFNPHAGSLEGVSGRTGNNIQQEAA
ncbi:TonB-dependent receptor, partial [Xanthovirga aplysinae]|uniref:TonB-dependent receptor n=1 Tax=Xanthovirga aplysinae TaxID=2529853 RepID=UPI00165721B6